MKGACQAFCVLLTYLSLGFIFAFIEPAHSTDSQTHPVVKTGLGHVKGWIGTSRDGRKYSAFTGVPYAKPPVDKLRLKSPEPADKWEGEWDATKPAPMCTQMLFFDREPKNITLGQEDCLYLNVYTPELKPKDLMPVLVYIHGGAWRHGSSGTYRNADYFMDEDVVLVSIHYRLGILGFLSTGDSVIPGNFGLKDQAFALKWVKDHIVNFGGDPSRITIFGESAGGASCHYLMISPLSKHLIKGAISQSGTINRIWSYNTPESARRKAQKVAELLSCPSSSKSEDILKCVQSATPESLQIIENKFLVWDFDPVVTFQPTTEPEGKGAFLTVNPFEVKINTPWMTGATSSEGAIKTGSLKVQRPEVLDQFIQNMDKFIPLILSIQGENEDVLKSAELIKERYFPDVSSREEVLKGLQRLYSEGFFYAPLLKAVENHEGPYVYLFDYRGGSSFVDLYGKQEEDLGVCHCDELINLFNYTELLPKKIPEDELVSRKLIRLWTNFAKHQNPTVEGTKWQRYKRSSSSNTMHITTELHMGDGFKEEVREFWDSLPVFRKARVKTEL